VRRSPAGFAWSFTNKLTQRRKGERTLLLRLRYSIFQSPRLRGMLTRCCVCQEISNAAKKGRERRAYYQSRLSRVCICAAFVSRVQTQRRRGEREELITNRGRATIVFELGLCQEVQTQRRGRERMSDSYRYRGRATSGIVLGL
jgi:hypothetical protein